MVERKILGLDAGGSSPSASDLISHKVVDDFIDACDDAIVHRTAKIILQYRLRERVYGKIKWPIVAAEVITRTGQWDDKLFDRLRRTTTKNLMKMIA